MNEDDFDDDKELADNELADEDADESCGDGDGMGLCMVLLQAETLDSAILQNELRKEFGEELEVDISEGGITSCSLDGGTIFFLHIQAPVPNQEAESAAEYYYFWEDGAAEVAKHRSHVIVTSMGTEQDAIDRILFATRGARAVLNAADSIGVYWGNGSIANSTETFLEMSEEADRDSLPLYLWIRFQLMPGETEDRVGLYTLGMSQFGEQEIEVVNTTWKVGEMMEFIYNVAHYILTSGNTIEDGNTIGGDEKQKITVSYEPSVLDAERTVYRIDLP